MATKKKEEQEAPKQKVKVTVSQILADLNNGIDRKGIREKYNLSATDVNRIFQHEKLKGKRVKSAPQFELEDDTEGQETKAEVKAEKPKTATEKPATTKPKAATAKVEEKEEEKEEKTAVELEDDTNAGGGIKEVSTPEDNVEIKEEKEEGKKGLW